MRGGRWSACPDGMPGRIGLGMVIASAMALLSPGVRAGAGEAKPDQLVLGYEIFNREWLPDDARSHGGDGLGPVYNDTSCVACHNAAGSGGAGPVSKNIDILSASRSVLAQATVEMEQFLTKGKNEQSPVPPAQNKRSTTLAEVHSGFRKSRNVVLHRFGTDPNYDDWRRQAFQTAVNPGAVIPMPAPAENPGAVLPTTPRGTDLLSADSTTARAEARRQAVRAAVLASNPGLLSGSMVVGGLTVSRSQRNPTPLFGLGLIDSIPDDVIRAMERRQAAENRDTRGRVSRLKDDRIGRLGWKGQTASTEDFVLNACAVELGLEVPGHAQAAIPQAPKYQAPGLDLNAEECGALVAYVRNLPRPIERAASSPAEHRMIKAGKAMFASIGCAKCHAPDLGKVEGLYSDLLLHDMGSDLGDDGSYDPEDPDDPDAPLPEDGNLAARPEPMGIPQRKSASRTEWRTPPLWGFRDSGPYLHDGRAQTLEQAVAFHGGQAEVSSQEFFELSPRERLQLETFLKSLVAPSTVQLARRGD